MICFLHTINYDKERGFFFSDDYNLDDEYCEGCTEVIGNIHKNKELVDFMEKEKKSFKEFHQKFENKYDENGTPVKEFYEEYTRLSIYFKQELEKLFRRWAIQMNKQELAKERKAKRYALLKEAKELKAKMRIKTGLKIREMKEKALKIPII